MFYMENVGSPFDASDLGEQRMGSFLAFFRGFLFAKAIVVETIIAAQSALRSAMTRTESFEDNVPDADFAS